MNALKVLHFKRKSRHKELMKSHVKQRTTGFPDFSMYLLLFLPHFLCLSICPARLFCPCCLFSWTSGFGCECRSLLFFYGVTNCLHLYCTLLFLSTTLKSILRSCACLVLPPGSFSSSFKGIGHFSARVDILRNVFYKVSYIDIYIFSINGEWMSVLSPKFKCQSKDKKVLLLDFLFILFFTLDRTCIVSLSLQSKLS